MTPYLELRGIGKRFGEHQVLTGVDLSVRQGELVCLLGPSGCGKTTLLRIIAGFEQASSGALLLQGQDILGQSPHQRGFGMVFQSLALFPHMTVAANIGYGMKLKGIDAKARAARVHELLETIQLPGMGDRPVSALSGGQRQRVAIARALAVPPKLFLLDEPLSALDAQIRESMQIELRQLQQKFGVTTLIVTHDQHEAMMLGDRLMVLRGGQVQQCATPGQMYRQPANAFVAEFLGAANLVRGRVLSAESVELLGHAVALSTGMAAGTPILLALRSEDIRLQGATVGQAAGTGSTGNVNLPAQVEFVRDLGATVDVLLRCGGQVLRCRGQDAWMRQAQAGQAVTLSFDAMNCNWLNEDAKDA
ncbi:ABC transporter ATP-binding protein [Ottowia testudinis]|uniref:ABC transporter ATP-binding protein n=1 Tax=Ottowia testudinis TaxID=2816950 RepID=A0A975H441_9BURK|nr:ABC transporter ATP-binding protein [Ottowia testudinis]QTD46503.1 ABC transporter ATP-binding protein [Ottowia testudinis]